MKKLLSALLLLTSFTAQAGWNDYDTNMYNGQRDNKGFGGGGDNGYYNPNSYQNNNNNNNNNNNTTYDPYNNGRFDSNGLNTNPSTTNIFGYKRHNGF